MKAATEGHRSAEGDYKDALARMLHGGWERGSTRLRPTRLSGAVVGKCPVEDVKKTIWTRRSLLCIFVERFRREKGRY